MLGAAQRRLRQPQHRLGATQRRARLESRPFRAGRMSPPSAVAGGAGQASTGPTSRPTESRRARGPTRAGMGAPRRPCRGTGSWRAGAPARRQPGGSSSPSGSSPAAPCGPRRGHRARRLGRRHGLLHPRRGVLGPRHQRLMPGSCTRATSASRSAWPILRQPSARSRSASKAASVLSHG